MGMFNNDNRIKFYTSSIGSDKLEVYQNTEVMSMLLHEYIDFEICFIPKGYDICFILLEEHFGDSSKDKWKQVFFKKEFDMSEVTITLDNMDSFDDAKSKYVIYKEIGCNYLDVLQTSCDLITKHRTTITKSSEESS